MQSTTVRNMRYGCRIAHGMHKNGRRCNAGQESSVDHFQDEDHFTSISK